MREREEPAINSRTMKQIKKGFRKKGDPSRVPHISSFFILNSQFLFVVFVEEFQPLLQDRELAARGEGDAGAETFAAFAAAGDQ